jgi:hypothetical protein
MQNKQNNFKICTLLQNLSICKNMHIQILDLISWHRETNLFRTLLKLTIIKKSMQMLEVPKPSYHISETPTKTKLGYEYLTS